jgi:hypothetical protein
MTTRLLRASVIALSLAGATGLAAQDRNFTLRVNKAAGTDIYMGMARTKPVATTGSDGSASLPLDFLNDAALKPRMSVARQQCGAETTLHILRAQGDEEKRCRRGGASQGCSRCAVLGYFQWGRNAAIDRPLLKNPRIAMITSATIGAAIALAQGGGGPKRPAATGQSTSSNGTTTPTPTPTPVTEPVVRSFATAILVLQDPAAHNALVQYFKVLQVFLQISSNGAVRLIGEPPWVALDGTMTPMLQGAVPSSGTITARGTGTVAERPGVLVVLDQASLNAAGELSGVLTIGGPGGTLLPNSPIVYRLTGREIK